jgi:hypothetical protein
VPPFKVSHVNYEVMDKQMSCRILLIIVRSSKNFWGVPPLFNYWSEMPQIVVGYGKPREFAIQWLTTLDTLAGFTQVETKPKEQRELVFTTRHALWRFI